MASFVVPDRIVEEGKRRGEIRADAVSSQVAILIVSTLEGSLMVSRLQRKDDSRKDRLSVQLLHSASGSLERLLRAQATLNLSPAMCLGMRRGEEILSLSSLSRIDLEKTDNESAT